MSRATTLFLIIGAVFLALAGTVSIALLLVRSYFVIADSEIIMATPAPVQEVSGGEPTPTPEETVDVTTVPPTPEATDELPVLVTSPAATPAVQPVTPTAVAVRTTSVRYVQALAAVNVRTGPATRYDVVGWLAAGETAEVTGISGDSSWWRVACPDGGDCWVTALAEYTQPVDAPVSPAPTATATAAPAACTYAATLVSHMTMPDGSEVPTGVEFEKTWRIQNSGSCTWDGRTFLVHAGGPLLGAAFAQAPLPGTVAPGENVDLSVPLRSPVTPGSYQSDWQLEAPDGTRFGLFSIRLGVFATPTLDGSISGLVFIDANGNGRYEGGETVAARRTVQLLEGNSCQVGDTIVDGMATDENGRYLFSGRFTGEYCIVLVGPAGLEDVVPLSVTSGQVVDNANLIVP